MAKTEQQNGFEVAVVGMAGRFPGARNIQEFWHNLRSGVESISFFSDEELLASGVKPAQLKDPNFVRAGGALQDFDLFDASFFGYTPREAEFMDPQQRIFLECAWEALENAGYDAQQYERPIGLYAGVSMSTYLVSHLSSHPGAGSVMSGLQMRMGNDKDFLCTRTSYKLNLKGPSVAVQTACSTSLVAIHLACQALLAGECEMALAGGVAVSVPQKVGYQYQVEGILSPDGHCRVFDARAQGTVGGNGVGIVVLKRLADALADGDTIYALLKGSAINNDGSAKVGFTAPSIDGEASVIAAALAVAQVHPETIGYIEAHGTGTPLGDPIEIAALTQAFRAVTQMKRFCAVGSVKTNIGHLDAAAGVASFIKAVMALQHGEIPASLHFEQANPKIDFHNSPFYVNNKLVAWNGGPSPRRAGVSSFGFGGTNAHAVLEEAPVIQPSAASRPAQLLILSARTSSALESATTNLAAHLKQHPELPLADVAFTLQMGRRAFNHRRMLVCRETSDAARVLETLDPKRLFNRVCENSHRPIAFMFPGQGAQYPGMGRELYETEFAFRDSIDRCAQILASLLNCDIREVLFTADNDAREAQARLRETLITQPAIFVVEYAMARLWMSWGVEPQAMIGHSIGEFVAACLAGVFSLEDVLTLVAARGQLMQKLPTGAMLSVPLAESELRKLAGKELSIAAINAPSLCVVSGPAQAVERLEHELSIQGIHSRRLVTSHAFHSEMMDPIVEPFRKKVRDIKLNPPQIPFISNVTGTWITPTQATDACYWARHVREPVRFAAGLEKLFGEPDRLLLEVGPGQTLSTLASAHSGRAREQLVFTSMRHPNDPASDVEFLLGTLGQLWLAGIPVRWSLLYAHERRRRVALPTYPFQRRRFWIDAPQVAPAPDSRHDAQRKAPDMADWFYVPSWKRSAGPTRAAATDSPSTKTKCWMILSEPYGLGRQITRQLEKAGQLICKVTPGEEFVAIDERTFTIRPQHREDWDRLLDTVRGKGMFPTHILHAWAATAGSPRETVQDRTFYSLLYLAQAIGKRAANDPVSILILTNQIFEVTGEENLCPEMATVLGPCQVIPCEFPHIRCRLIDVLYPQPSAQAEQQLMRSLQAEFAASNDQQDAIVAYRGHHRWTQTFEPLRLGAARERPALLRPEGVYLITGGLGGIGLELAEFLARSVQAKLILISRSALPDRNQWDHWLASHAAGDPISRKITKIRALEELGSEVLNLSADVADWRQMESALAKALDRFGSIHGVIHAAGLPDGALIQRRTRDLSESVLAPKVLGTLVLDRLLCGHPLDFFVLCSSLASVVPPTGQVAYCAANAFQDAYACYKRSRDGTPTTAINWDTWQDVGMAVEAVKRLIAVSGSAVADPAQGESEQLVHAWFEQHRVEPSADEVFISFFDLGKRWALDEHRISGAGVLPGTAYVEMARSALAHHNGSGDIEIREVCFLAPLVVREHETREVRTILRSSQNGYEFRIISKSGSEMEWQEHARGTIAHAAARRPQQLNIEEIKARIDERDGRSKAINVQPKSSFIQFGPRWNTLREIRASDEEGLAVVELPEQFASDLEEYPLHPAMLDAATAFLLNKARKQESNYLPFLYRGMRIKGPFTRRIYSHARYLNKDQASQDTLSFAITVTDEHGKELIEIDEYVLRRVDADQFVIAPAATLTHAAEEQTSRSLTSVLEHGLLAAEGKEVFARILESRLPQVLVSTLSLTTRIERTRSAEKGLFDRPERRSVARQSAHPRPDLSTTYVAPRNDIEHTLHAIWEHLLGIEQIGVYDNFFELGGHSLLGVQLISRLRDQFHVEMPMGSIFEEPTIAGLAGHISVIQWAAKQELPAAVQAGEREEIEL